MDLAVEFVDGSREAMGREQRAIATWEEECETNSYTITLASIIFSFGMS